MSELFVRAEFASLNILLSVDIFEVVWTFLTQLVLTPTPGEYRPLKF